MDAGHSTVSSTSHAVAASTASIPMLVPPVVATPGFVAPQDTYVSDNDGVSPLTPVAVNLTHSELTSSIPPLPNPDPPPPPPFGNMASIEIMMRRIQQESEDRLKDFMSRSVSDAVATHVQPLRSEIAQERTERTQQFLSYEMRFNNLDGRLASVESAQSSHVSASSANIGEIDEVVIGGFDKLRFSRDGAIAQCQHILSNVSGSPTIVHDRVANAPTVVTVKFSSSSAAQSFVKSQKDCKYFDGFWSNLHQSKADRQRFNNEVKPLYKIKRAILELTHGLDSKQIVVDKVAKQVYMVDGHRLKLLAEMISKTNIKWHNNDIGQDIKDRAKALIAEIKPVRE